MLKKETLLRIDARSIMRSDIKKQRVKSVRISNKSTPAAERTYALVLLSRLGSQPFSRPVPALRRYFTDALYACKNIFCKLTE